MLRLARENQATIHVAEAPKTRRRRPADYDVVPDLLSMLAVMDAVPGAWDRAVRARRQEGSVPVMKDIMNGRKKN